MSDEARERYGTVEAIDAGVHVYRLDEPLHGHRRHEAHPSTPDLRAKNVEVGDRVRLTYRTSWRSGLWFAEKVDGDD